MSGHLVEAGECLLCGHVLPFKVWHPFRDGRASIGACGECWGLARPNQGPCSEERGCGCDDMTAQIGRNQGETVETKEAPDQTVKASERAAEVVAAFQKLRAQDPDNDNAKHLWALAAGMVADLHRGSDNYPKNI